MSHVSGEVGEGRRSGDVRLIEGLIFSHKS